MPLYEYECTECKRHTEKIQKFSDPEITTCPHCGGKLERVITAPAIAFKGGGWYADGYGNAKPASSKSDSGSDSGSSAGSSSEGSGSSSSKDSAGATSSSTPAPAAAPAASSTPISTDKK